MTENVKNLFSFIDFLHSNKDYFLSKKPFLDEVKLLREEEQKLDLKNNPEDILKSREINSAIDKIIDPVFYEIRELIETNVLKFNISNDFDVKKGININAYSDLAKLENTFESNDIEVIKTALNRYYDFKTSSFKIVSGFFDMTSNYLFDHLDEIFSETLGVFGAKAIKKEESIPEPQLIANQKSESIPAPQQEIVENDFLISTIEDYLEEFKESKVLNEENYKTLVDALKYYFEKGKFPELKHPIHVGRVNKKKIGWSLNGIFAARGESVNVDLLKFAKNNISLFTNEKFDENNFRNGNFYKYFTTKT